MANIKSQIKRNKQNTVRQERNKAVRSELRTPGKDPVQLDYRVEKTDAGWKVYDLNVLGVWLVDTYRGQFAQEINANGIDGLIAALAQRNRSNAAEKPPTAVKG